MAERKSYDPPHGFCIQTFSVFVFICPYLSSTPGLKVSLERVSSDRFSYDLHQGLRRTFTSRGSPEYTHGVRRLTMLVHRFNAQPMTIQRLHCCLSSPHRICLAVSMAVVPSKRNSSMFGSRQQVCERSTAIQLSSYEGERDFPLY